VARSSTKRFPVTRDAVFRGILDTWIWMAFLSGVAPAEIITQRDAAKPAPDDTRRPLLSRAERRQWERLVRRLR
jgi:hypothetical protein